MAIGPGTGGRGHFSDTGTGEGKRATAQGRCLDRQERTEYVTEWWPGVHRQDTAEETERKAE